jgi:hypothetical protein
MPQVKRRTRKLLCMNDTPFYLKCTYQTRTYRLHAKQGREMRLCLKRLEPAFSPIAYAVVVTIGENQIEVEKNKNILLSQTLSS